MHSLLIDKLEFVYFLMIGFHHFIIELIDSASPAQHHTEDRTDDCLQDLIRHFEDRIFGRAVNKCSAERVPNHHNNRADRHADSRRDDGMLLHNIV